MSSATIVQGMSQSFARKEIIVCETALSDAYKVTIRLVFGATGPGE